MSTPALAKEPAVRARPAIHVLRGGPVILDADLAARLGVETRALNQAVKRNIERFPEGWAFQITAAEQKTLGLEVPVGRGGRRALPWAFSEHGVVMATSLLKSPAAIQAMQRRGQKLIRSNSRRWSESCAS